MCLFHLKFYQYFPKIHYFGLGLSSSILLNKIYTKVYNITKMVLFLCLLTDTPTREFPSSDVTTTKTATTTQTHDVLTQNDDACSGFDAASFIGGIVLMGGIYSISFFAYKFWQARTEHNYHTL